MGRNATFRWYVKVVSPVLKQQASNEGKNNSEQFNPTNLSQFPISSFLRHIALTNDIINELDSEKFTIQVFHSGLLYLQSKLGSMNALEDQSYLAHPSTQDASRKKQVGFSEVIHKLVETRFDYDKDLKLKEAWV